MEVEHLVHPIFVIVGMGRIVILDRIAILVGLKMGRQPMIFFPQGDSLEGNYDSLASDGREVEGESEQNTAPRTFHTRTLALSVSSAPSGGRSPFLRGRQGLSRFSFSLTRHSRASFHHRTQC